MPGEIIREIATQRGADHRRYHDGDAEQVRKPGHVSTAGMNPPGSPLRRRHHAAARKSLDNAKDEKAIEG